LLQFLVYLSGGWSQTNQKKTGKLAPLLNDMTCKQRHFASRINGDWDPHEWAACRLMQALCLKWVDSPTQFKCLLSLVHMWPHT